MRILLVEDDEGLGDSIRNALKHYGNVIDWVKNGLDATNAIQNETFDVIILDIGLPKVNGYQVLSRMRNEGNTTPVLILTARDMLEDRVKGLDLGADDYLVKPFDLKELDARLRALQRRSSARAVPMVYYGDLALDPASHIVTYKGDIVNMPRREFSLLQKLLENEGRVLSREYLSQTLYGWDDNVDSNAIEVHIHNLRKKFGQDFVRTIRGIGYMVDKSE